MTDVPADRVLEPLERTTWRYGVALAVIAMITALFLFGWLLQLRNGVVVTGLGDVARGGGIPWGLYIGGFVWWIGVAHGGIAISAAVRVFDVERFRPIARIAELLTIGALAVAALNIVVSIGRPDRIFNTIVFYPLRMEQSPLSWDIAVITLYLVLSMTYLIFSMRKDVYAFRDRLPDLWGPIYSVVLIGYSPGEEEKVEQMLWWLAVAILALVALISGGVVPWLFSLVAAQPGWFGAAAGPSMLVESLTAAIAIVTVVAGVFRYACDWEFIDDAVFRGLAKVTAFLSLGVLWMLLHDVLPGTYVAPLHVEELTTSMLDLTAFWIAVALVVVPLLYLVASLLGPTIFTVPGVVIASGAIAVGIWIEKVLFVVDGLLHPTVPPLSNIYPAASYTPTAIELGIALSMFALPALLFAIAVKIVPLVDLPTEEVGA